jgi:hypothetical protein
MFTSTTHRLATLVRTQLLGLIALLIVLTGGTALAADSAKTAAKNTVTSKSIKNGQVKTADLAPAAVTGDKLGLDSVASAQVKNGTLTGDDVNESTLGIVPNASSLGGVAAASYLRGTVVQKESTVAAGTDLGDGTFAQILSCDPGDILLSGGPANVSPTSDMVELFPTAGPPNSLKVRINPHAVADNFSVVILCLDRP